MKTNTDSLAFHAYRNNANQKILKLENAKKLRYLLPQIMETVNEYKIKGFKLAMYQNDSWYITFSEKSNLLALNPKKIKNFYLSLVSLMNSLQS